MKRIKKYFFVIIIFSILLCIGCNSQEKEEKNEVEGIEIESIESKIEKDEKNIEVRGNVEIINTKISLSMLENHEEATEYEFFSLNSYGTKEYFVFEGIPMLSFFDIVGINEEFSSAIFEAEDGYKVEISYSDLIKVDYIDEQNKEIKYPVVLAWKENGEKYDESEGYPFRLVIGQKEEGDVNKPNWIYNINKIEFIK